MPKLKGPYRLWKKSVNGLRKFEKKNNLEPNLSKTIDYLLELVEAYEAWDKKNPII